MKKPKKVKTGLLGPLPFKLGELRSPQIGSSHATDILDRSPVENVFQVADRNARELLSRAYGQSWDRWEGPWSDPGDMDPERLKEDRRAREALLEALNSPNSKKRKDAKIVHKQLVELDQQEAHKAAIHLALLGQQIAFFLELLADECPELMTPIGRRFSSWPFNLALTKTKTTGNRDLLRVKSAKDCLLKLEIGLKHPYTDVNSSVETRPLRIVAVQIYGFLCDVRSAPHRYFLPIKLKKRPAEPRIALPKQTAWAKRLFRLKEPMTRANFNEWWRVAKELLLEVWDENYRHFDRLIQYTGQKEKFEGETYKPGQAKSRIIDRSLKPHFQSLALPR